jgi:hypothetical protein
MDWFDFKVPKPVKVMYLQRELGDAWMQQRSKQIYQGFSDPDYRKSIFDRAGVDCPEGIDFKILEENLHIPEPVHLKLDDDEDMERLIAQIIRGNYKFIVIDPLFIMIKGNENDTQDMMKVMDNLIKLKEVAKVSVLLIHHFGKSTGVAKGAHAHRGSSVIGGSSDGNITLKELEDSLIASNGLDGLPGEYGVLEFEMRNGAPRDAMIMWRNGDHLIWERAKTGINREKPPQKGGVPIITLMEGVGEPIVRTDLIILMLENGWGSRPTCARHIAKQIESRLLFTMKTDEHGAGSLILLPEWRL